MTENLPDYSSIEVPDEKPKSEYNHHERRADMWGRMEELGSPAAINKSELARIYDVNRSTIYRDFERLREWAGDTLGRDATLISRAVFNAVVPELLNEDDWRAKAEAFDIVMEWQEWLQDIGEQDREPTRHEVTHDTADDRLEQLMQGIGGGSE